MEPASSMFEVSFRQTLRKGQKDAVDNCQSTTDLNVQLPTGYGKTLTAASIYATLQNSGKVNRLLYIVPTTAQLDQFVKDGPDDLFVSGVLGSRVICDIGFSGTKAISQHRSNKSSVFACTIQALISGKSVFDTVKNIMETGRWMICVDEYHHYGNSAEWGKKVCALNYVFRLAMSATPYRKNEDSAFGEPHVIVSYRDAVFEKAVKPLECHSYVYRIDAIGADGSVHTYTTEELAEEAGGNSPDAIEKMRLERQMRWSPKYVSPLVDRPIARMIRDRIRTGYPLQVLIGAMSCSHAELVCEQVRAMYPELRVDWVGTGMCGRSDKENRDVLKRFCPPKVDGERRPNDIGLDVLVHVAMAGEGLDSIYVSEVVHLNPANINNTNNQENGRAARYLPGVVGRINVDSCSEYARFTGESIMDVLDNPCAEPPEDNGKGKPEEGDGDWSPLPEPVIRIWDMECIRVDEGEVRRFAGSIAACSAGFNPLVMNDPAHPFWAILDENKDHPAWKLAMNGYRAMRAREAEQLNDRSVVEQWIDKVGYALSRVTSLVIRVINDGNRYDKSLPGDIKKRINSRKKKEVGALDKDAELAKQHYYWLADLEALILKSGLPSWLA